MGNDPADTSDTDIRMAYNSIAQNGSLDWLLLSYGKWAGGLKLVAAGSKGISELKQHADPDTVFFAFCREYASTQDVFATITYVPESVSGLRRARAVATSRTVASWFKVSQAMLAVSRLNDLTSHAVLRAVRHQAIPGLEIPELVESPQSTSPPPISRVNSDSFNMNFNTQKSLPHAPNSDFIRRAQSTGPETRRPTHKPSSSRLGSGDFLDPAERARRRQEAILRQQIEDETAAKEEELRQVRIKREKAEVLRRAEEEERRRREALEQDLKRAANAKAAKEEEERVSAELRAIERELKKKHDAEKRLAEKLHIEAWRKEEQRRLEEVARHEEEARLAAKKGQESAAMTAQQLREQKLGQGQTVLLTGWVTIQTSNSLVWRRRYFQLTETCMKMYKNDKDLSKVLDSAELTGHISGVKEWNEGFEELRSIPNSFAITFTEKDPLFVYTASQEEKNTLAGFLLTYV